LDLSACKFNKSYVISGIKECCPIKIKRRLFDLGFLPQTEIKILRKSMLKKVYLIEIREYVLSAQRELCEYVLVEER